MSSSFRRIPPSTAERLVLVPFYYHPHSSLQQNVSPPHTRRRQHQPVQFCLRKLHHPMHSLVALPLTFHLSLLQRIESTEPPRVRRCSLRQFSPVYIDYFCLYCILSGLPAGHIISLTVLGFVILFGAYPSHPYTFLACLPMQTLILIPHSSLSLSGSSRGGVDSLHSFFCVPILSLSYSFTLTFHLLGRRLFLHRMAALPSHVKFNFFPFSRL